MLDGRNDSGANQSMKTGKTRVTVHVHGRRGHADMEMVADTGATLTMIPETVAKKI